tara:strand:- start:243 stop:386 length:144 start_codon:yes stop_codon:yes gene_type:complete
MAKVENDLEYIHYAVGNANTQRQENELPEIMINVILHDGSSSQQVPQ